MAVVGYQSAAAYPRLLVGIMYGYETPKNKMTLRSRHREGGTMKAGCVVGGPVSRPTRKGTNRGESYWRQVCGYFSCAGSMLYARPGAPTADPLHTETGGVSMGRDTPARIGAVQYNTIILHIATSVVGALFLPAPSYSTSLARPG
jgi:hypothetical protein